jgi:hypothetical protein
MNANDFDREDSINEWEAQEQARRDEQRGVDGTQSEPSVQQYRLIARALRDAPMDPLPRDFAGQTALHVQRMIRGEDERFEAAMESALVGLLITAGIASIFFFGGPWLATLIMPMRKLLASEPSSGGWIFVGALCLAVSTAFDLWRRQNLDRPSHQ